MEEPKRKTWIPANNREDDRKGSREEDRMGSREDDRRGSVGIRCLVTLGMGDIGLLFSLQFHHPFIEFRNFL